MARKKKDGVKKSYYIDKEIAEALCSFCERSGRTETKVIELAITDFIKKHTIKDDEGDNAKLYL